MGSRKKLCGIWLLLAFLCGCGGQAVPEPSAESLPPAAETAAFFAMDTVMELTIYGESQLLEQAEARVAQLEGLYSVTDEASEIYAVNQTGEAALSEDTAALLSFGLELCRQTRGALDLSVYPVVRAWGFTTGEYRVPEEDELAELLERVSHERVTLNEENRSVTLEPGMEIDLGSIAKGYTGDQLIALFREAGVTSALLNLGGNIQVLGSKPDGSPWRIGIKDPSGEGNLGGLSITDCAVITSGGYERYFEENGRTYWHIIDPATGYPAENGLISVTVVGKSGALCDGLSTALFVMGLENAENFWRSSDAFEAVFVQEDGSVLITEGLENSFSLLDSSTPLAVIRRD